MAIQIETETNSKGYKIIICLSNETREKESESIKTMINGNVDGLIISLSKETQITRDYGHFEEALNTISQLYFLTALSGVLSLDGIM